MPLELPADKACAGDENVQLADLSGVELVGPVPGRSPEVDAEALMLDDFAYIETMGVVDAFPLSHVTEKSDWDFGKQIHGWRCRRCFVHRVRLCRSDWCNVAMRIMCLNLLNSGWLRRHVD